MIFLVCKALKRVKFCNLATYSNTPHAYQRCTNSGGHSTGSPLVRTPRQGLDNWFDSSTVDSPGPKQLDSTATALQGDVGSNPTQVLYSKQTQAN